MEYLGNGVGSEGDVSVEELGMISVDLVEKDDGCAFDMLLVLMVNEKGALEEHWNQKSWKRFPGKELISSCYANVDEEAPMKPSFVFDCLMLDKDSNSSLEESFGASSDSQVENELNSHSKGAWSCWRSLNCDCFRSRKNGVQEHLEVDWNHLTQRKEVTHQNGKTLRHEADSF
jgi:hypothetical protein